MEPLRSVLAGETLPPLNPLKVGRKKEHEKSSRRHFDRSSSERSHKRSHIEAGTSSSRDFLGPDLHFGDKISILLGSTNKEDVKLATSSKLA